MNEKDATYENLFRKVAFQDDEQAFKELFLEFYPALCVFATRYILSLETCEDIVQDTFYQLWKNRKKIEITSSFRNLLITSVKNECTDYLRKQSVRKGHAERQSASGITNATDTPETIYTINEMEEMIRRALEQLPENVRKVFELSRFEKMTYHQIAKEIAISPKTVEAYIGKALSILRYKLRDYLPKT